MGPIARVLYFRLVPTRTLDAAARFVVLAALAVGAALATGRLAVDDWSVITCDVARALPFVEAPPEACPESSGFPFLRDYASLFHLLMIAVMGSYGSVLIGGLEEFWRTAIGDPALLQPTHRERVLLPWVGNTRRRALSDIAVLIVGAVMCYVGLLGYEHNGIYPVFAVTTPQDEFAAAALRDSWSAAPQLGFFVFLIVGTIGNYYIVHIGVAAVISLYVATVASIQHRLGLQHFSAAAKWGWGPAFDAVSSGVVTSVFGLLGLLALLLRGGYENLPYLLAFPVVSVAAIVPWVVVNRVWRRAVDEARVRLAALVAASGSARTARVEHVAYVGVLAAPPRMVSIAATVFQLAFTVLPGLITLAQTMTVGGAGTP